MDRSKTIKKIQDHISSLKQIREALLTIEESVVSIENDVIKEDESLPDESLVDSLKDAAEREQVLHLYDLVDEAYSLIDEIIGPPQQAQEGEGQTDAALSSIEEIIKNYRPSSKLKTN